MKKISSPIKKKKKKKEKKKEKEKKKTLCPWVTIGFVDTVFINEDVDDETCSRYNLLISLTEAKENTQ